MEPIFTIETKLEPRDYRNFLYTATFRQKAYVPFLLIGIALAGAYLVQKANDWDSLASFLGLWVFFVAVSVASLCVRVERANACKPIAAGFFTIRSSFAFLPTGSKSTTQPYNPWPRFCIPNSTK